MKKHPGHIKFTIDSDSFNGSTTYTVKEMFDDRREDERGVYYAIGSRLVDSFTMTWDEIDEQGGPVAFMEDLKNRYGIKK